MLLWPVFCCSDTNWARSVSCRRTHGRWRRLSPSHLLRSVLLLPYFLCCSAPGLIIKKVLLSLHSQCWMKSKLVNQCTSWEIQVFVDGTGGVIFHKLCWKQSRFMRKLKWKTKCNYLQGMLMRNHGPGRRQIKIWNPLNKISSYHQKLFPPLWKARFKFSACSHKIYQHIVKSKLGHKDQMLESTRRWRAAVIQGSHSCTMFHLLRT